MRNKENLNKWQKENYKKKKNDPEYKAKKKESSKRYYENNKEKCLEKRKEYFEVNKEQYRKYRREWRYSSPAGILECLRSSAKKRGIEFLLEKEQFAKWYNKQEKKCHYCKRTFEECKKDSLNESKKRFTIDRTNNDKGYLQDNIVLSCYRCNAVKSNYFTEEEMLKIGDIINVK